MSVRNLRGTGGVNGLQENRDCRNSRWSDSRTEEEWLDILLLQSLGSGRSFSSAAEVVWREVGYVEEQEYLVFILLLDCVSPLHLLNPHELSLSILEGNRKVFRIC